MIDILAITIMVLIVSTITLYVVYKIDLNDNSEFWKYWEE